jgi:methylase of polypeptide subunit release factors
MPDLFAGTTFERAMPTAERRRWGRFYTAPSGVDLVLQLCLRHASDRVLDPSCGAGVFLARAAVFKQRLDPTRDIKAIADELWGVEVDRDAVAEATQNLQSQGLTAHIVHADFFTLDPADWPTFDCIVGNPPYTRQEWIRELAPGGDKSVLINRALDGALPSAALPSAARLTRRASLHAYFFVHAARFLREGGRLGFITSNSWLDVDYGAGLQAFLLNNFRIVAVVESQVERWFADADVNTCLVSLERCADPNARDDNVVRFVRLCCPLKDESLCELADQILDAVDGESPDIRARAIRQGDLQERKPVFGAAVAASRTHRWGTLLRAPQVYLDALDRNRDRLVPLKTLARIRRGYTAGANEFFYLNRETAAQWNIEAEFLRPVLKSPRDCASLSIDSASLPLLAFVVHRGKRALAGTNALRYIVWGESRGFHMRPTCAARDRWYDIGERPPAHLAWIKGVWNRHFCPLLPAERIALDQQVYGVELLELAQRKLIAALLNSTWAALCAEMGGRVNFGEGILWVAAYEAGQLPLPDPARIPDAQAAALEVAFDALAAQPVLPLPEQMMQPNRVALDDRVFDLLQLDAAERWTIRVATMEVVRARLARARSVGRISNLKSRISKKPGSMETTSVE